MKEKSPNSLEVILVAQSLIGKYKDAYGSCSDSSHRISKQNKSAPGAGGPWQLIIKVASARAKKFNRVGFAYEAKTCKEIS